MISPSIRAFEYSNSNWKNIYRYFNLVFTLQFANMYLHINVQSKMSLKIIKFLILVPTLLYNKNISLSKVIVPDTQISSITSNSAGRYVYSIHVLMYVISSIINKII